MTRKHPFITSALLWIICLGALHAQDLPADSLPGLGGASAEDVAVEATIEPSRQAPGQPVVAVVTFDMPEGWYIFSDSVGLELTSPAGEGAPVRAGELHRPRPKSKFDDLLEQQVDYYEGQLRVRRGLHLRENAPQGELNLTLEAAYQACSPNVCYQPTSVEVEATLQVLPSDAEPVEVTLPQKEEPVGPTDGTDASSSGQWVDRLEGQGLLATMILSFLAGLALSLTPCVYPMIPITVSVIGATATESRLSGLGRSLVYVLGISLMYAALGLVAAASGRAFGTVLQNPAVYVGLAVLFVLLAAAMFDLFSIQLFSSWANRLQHKEH
jgi:thiol:disulfide interchange protein DsbD